MVGWPCQYLLSSWTGQAMLLRLVQTSHIKQIFLQLYDYTTLYVRTYPDTCMLFNLSASAATDRMFTPVKVAQSLYHSRLRNGDSSSRPVAEEVPIMTSTNHRPSLTFHAAPTLRERTLKSFMCLVKS